MRRGLVAVLLVFIVFGVFGAFGSATFAKEAQKDGAGEKSGKESAKEAKEANGDRYENLGLFQKVLYFIEQNYVEEVKNKDLIYGAIKGMMDTLDPHSNFLPPEIFKDMKTDTSGKFGGVGIEIGLKDSILTVVTPIDDTPAYKAGLKAGDKILKINGESTKGMSLSEAVAKMRGKRGSDVVMSIWRDGLDKPKEYRVTRAEIKIQTTKSESLEPGYLYMRLTNFNEQSTDSMKHAMAEFEKKEPIRGLVFDLRNNPGGLLDQAVSVSSLFMDDGVIVSTKTRNKETDIQTAKKGMARKDFPVAVLVNGASASASEIVAGALQDHKRAVIMGQPTFGKGSVQTVIELQPEVGLKLTIARYYTPSGRSIQLKGIQPDILLDDFDQKTLDDALRKGSFIRERDLKHHMTNELSDEKEFRPDEYMLKDGDKAVDDKKKEKARDDFKPFVAKEDYQVRQALNYIKSYQIFRAAGLEAPDAGVKTATDKKRK
ncbi:MAG: S41 family peptidase [Deltaproteobacteria bacterium]|nr:S41 family peptidase [Deltaproteobacteria bacterium]